MGSSTKQKTMNTEYRRLNLKKIYSLYVSIHTIAIILFLSETAPQGGEVPACSLQAWLLLGRRSQGHLDCSIAPAHLLLLMQLQGHLLTSKMTQIEKTQVLFPKQKPKGSQNQLVEV